MGFCYSKFFKPPVMIKNQKGFSIIALLPFVGLLITSLLGISVMTLGIKNITESKKICIAENLKMQKELKKLLEDLLALNKKVISLYNKKRVLKQSLKTATLSGNLLAIAPLKLSIKTIDLAILKISMKQKMIIAKAQFVKSKKFNQFKKTMNKKHIKDISQRQFFNSALAVRKKYLDSKSVIYEPMPNFEHLQKTALSWKMQAFQGLYSDKFFQYQCVATIERSHNKWRERLFH